MIPKGLFTVLAAKLNEARRGQRILIEFRPFVVEANKTGQKKIEFVAYSNKYRMQQQQPHPGSYWGKQAMDGASVTQVICGETGRYLAVVRDGEIIEHPGAKDHKFYPHATK